MKLLLIGCGCVGKTLLEHLNLEKNNEIPNHIKLTDIVIIEPRTVPKWIKDMYNEVNLVHIKKGLTRTNMETILKPYLEQKYFVVDLSVNTDTIKLALLCGKQYKCNYINTSIENYGKRNPEIFPTTEAGLIKSSLMHEIQKLDKLYGSTKTSIGIGIGQNPGKVSHFALQGIIDYTNKYGTQLQKNICNDEEYNKLALSLGLEKVQIVEYDSQLTKKKRPDNQFWNSWSCVGMYSEGRDPVQKSNKVFPMRGCDTYEKSMYMNDKGKMIEYDGMLIPHMEAYTLSKFLSVKRSNYIPEVYYIYRPSEVCIESLRMFAEGGYKDIPVNLCKTLEQKDIKSGYDSVGCLLHFNNGKKWYTGEVLSLKDVKKMGFKHSAPTPIQVTSNLIANIKYIQKHKQEGLLDSEDLPTDKTIQLNKPYSGKYFSKEVKE